jgi:hypothetical protein
MLRRLLLVLLLMAVTAPAAAMTGHCPPPQSGAHHAMTHDHRNPARHEAPHPAGAAQKDCIGCVTPWRPGTFELGAPPIALASHAPLPVSRLASHGAHPEPRPPRS